jgi:hypothetical protein
VLAVVGGLCAFLLRGHVVNAAGAGAPPEVAELATES